MPYAEIRAELEADGYRLNDEEYMELVTYARRKAACAGKGEDYLPYLLPDVIKEHFVRMAINAYSLARMMEKKYA